MSECTTDRNYDAEPVAYCKHCYSLKVKHEDSIDADCCMDCGSTEIGTTDIHSWERLYQERYGVKYVEKNRDPRDSVYFKMTIEALKTYLYHSGKLYPIAHGLYSRFPGGYNKEESVILLFDRLCKDNRIDDLRYMLYYDSLKRQIL